MRTVKILFKCLENPKCKFRLESKGFCKYQKENMCKNKINQSCSVPKMNEETKAMNYNINLLMDCFSKHFSKFETYKLMRKVLSSGVYDLETTIEDNLEFLDFYEEGDFWVDVAKKMGIDIS